MPSPELRRPGGPRHPRQACHHGCARLRRSRLPAGAARSRLSLSCTHGGSGQQNQPREDPRGDQIDHSYKHKRRWRRIGPAGIAPGQRACSNSEAVRGSDRILGAPVKANSAIPLLAEQLGGPALLGLVAAVAFATVTSLIRCYFHDRELHRRPYRPGTSGATLTLAPLGRAVQLPASSGWTVTRRRTPVGGQLIQVAVPPI